MSVRVLPLACAALLGACVSLDQAPMAPDAIQKDQRVAVIVYPSPGPAMDEKSSNVDQMAKVIPGLGMFMSATQNTRDLDASRELQQYLPAWRPDSVFHPILMRELAASGSPGRFIAPSEAGLTDDALRAFNPANDVTDWLVRYCVANPAVAAPRNYASVPGLRGALVLEVNLAYGAPADGSGHWIPNLDAVTKLYDASDSRLLWRHEDSVSDPNGMRTPPEFEKNPADLLAKYAALMPSLAQAIARNFTLGLQQSGVFVAPTAAK